MKPESIKLISVTKHYGRFGVKAVDEVSLTIDQGEFVAVTGTSGSGKSTLLNLIAGLEHPDSGRVFIADKEPAGRGAWQKIRSEKIGIIFQSFHLLPTLTARENVEIPLFGRIRSGKSRSQIALSLLERVGLQGRQMHLPAELSGGERQRVAIARSLVNSPTILLADEPTGNLDTTTAEEILSLIRDIQQKEHMSVLLVTHDREIAAMTDKTIVMSDGRIVSEG